MRGFNVEKKNVEFSYCVKTSIADSSANTEYQKSNLFFPKATPRIANFLWKGKMQL